MIDRKENYYWDLGSERVKQYLFVLICSEVVYMEFFLFIQNPIEPMQVDIAPEGDYPPLEDNFTFESATLVGKPLHLSLRTT